MLDNNVNFSSVEFRIHTEPKTTKKTKATNHQTNKLRSQLDFLSTAKPNIKILNLVMALLPNICSDQNPTFN